MKHESGSCNFLQHESSIYADTLLSHAEGTSKQQNLDRGLRFKVRGLNRRFKEKKQVWFPVEGYRSSFLFIVYSSFTQFPLRFQGKNKSRFGITHEFQWDENVTWQPVRKFVERFPGPNSCRGGENNPKWSTWEASNETYCLRPNLAISLERCLADDQKNPPGFDLCRGDSWLRPWTVVLPAYSPPIGYPSFELHVKLYLT